MNPGSYRTRIALDFLQLLILPSLSLSTFLRLSSIHLNWLLAPPAHLLFILTFVWCKGQISRLIHARARYQLGAREVPCVVGRWPGNLDVLLKMIKSFGRSYIMDVYLELFEEYQCTTLNTRILWSDTIITMDQEHVKYIMATGFNNFWRGKYQKERMETFLGKGIFNRDDDIWRTHRSNTRPFFARERISDFECFEKYTSRTLGIISGSNFSHPCAPNPLNSSVEHSESAPIDAQDLYSRFTIDAASDSFFGKNLDTLSCPLPSSGSSTLSPRGSLSSSTKDQDGNSNWDSFTSAFEACQQVVTSRGRLGYFWPVLELFKDKNKENVDVVHGFLEPLVKEALDEKEKSRGVVSPVGEKTFLQHLCESTDDPIVIRDQLLSFLLASRDTTACLLTYVTYFMAIHPEVCQNLRAEVLEHCGPTNAPTYEQIRGMKYLRAVINETLRLFPPVPLNVRECRHSCTLPPSDPTFTQNPDPRPLYIPRNTPVMFFPLLIQRNRSLWGPDAESFDPQRWINRDRVKKFVENPTMWMPFSLGPRICVGQNYAYNEASYFLIRLLQQYDGFSLADECQPEGSCPPEEWKDPNRKGGCERKKGEKVWPGAALTLFVKGGLWVRFRKASRTEECA
ncbi:cytochrome P450 monooxygenase CYP63 [Marasmius fiardii PR-910]|nr:cytochrome P450 monooxygenase CYP63 [Marasmius fiardii PR-910]